MSTRDLSGEIEMFEKWTVMIVVQFFKYAKIN